MHQFCIQCRLLEIICNHIVFQLHCKLLCLIFQDRSLLLLRFISVALSISVSISSTGKTSCILKSINHHKEKTSKKKNAKTLDSNVIRVVKYWPLLFCHSILKLFTDPFIKSPVYSHTTWWSKTKNWRKKNWFVEGGQNKTISMVVLRKIKMNQVRWYLIIIMVKDKGPLITIG